MNADPTRPLSETEKVYFRAHKAAFDFGNECARFRDNYKEKDVVPLESIINTLMTELWDKCFSQSEIRFAFESALADMNRYAAGHERRP